MAVSAFGPCASAHTAEIHDRGGARRVNALVHITSVKWGRVQDDSSLATITIAGRKACYEQSRVLNAIDSRRHEIVVYRSGVRVFEGPILQVSWFEDRVVILARDVTEYLGHTSMSVPYPGPDLGGEPLMTDRILEIITNELTVAYDMRVGTGGAATIVTVPRWEAIDPPANVLPFLDVRSSATLETTAAVVAFQMTVMDHLKNLARGGLNFTTVGRSLLIYDSAYSIGSTRKLTNADFNGDIEVIQSGSDFDTIVHTSAQRPDGGGTPDAGVTPGVGHAGENDDYYGVWEYISSTESEEGETAPTQDALNSQAQRVRRGRYPMPLEMRIPSSSGLRLSHDLTINQLVPGVIMPVAATFNLKEVVQDQRLHTLQVEDTPAGELIQVNLVPAGPIEGLA